MPKGKWPAVMLAGVLLMALLAGLFYFAGVAEPNAYPSMSSLNAGPHGAKLLFDALLRMPPLAVSRNYLPWTQWGPSATTILLLGVRPFTLNTFDKQDLIELERLSRRNNRVVLGIQDDDFVGKANPKKPFLTRTRWGIQILRGVKNPVLENDASWHPVGNLKDAVEKRLVMGGTIVVALHGQDLSNESLASDAAAIDEIAPLIGRHTAVAFEETHLGIEESGSIAGLATRYRLHGLIAGLLILVGLFIWNQSVSFPPPPRFESERDTRVVGASARGMFAGLLARHLSPQVLIESCVAEWNRLTPRQRITSELSGKLDPVTAYRQLQETLPKKSSRL